MESFILDSLKFKIHPALGDTIVALGGKIDFAKGPDHTCIVIAEKRIAPVLQELGAELPDNLQTVDADFEVLVGARAEHKTEWVITEAMTFGAPNANGDEFSFAHLEKAFDGLPIQFKNEHANRLVSTEMIHQLLKKPSWATQIVCPVMQKWVDSLSWPAGATPTEVQLFTCGIGPMFMAYESTPKRFGKSHLQSIFDRNLPMQRAMWPSIDPLRTGLLGPS